MTAARVDAEYAIASPGGAVMPLAGSDLATARAIARPYLLNGALFVTRKVTATPVPGHGIAEYEAGPWREIRVPAATLGAAA